MLIVQYMEQVEDVHLILEHLICTELRQAIGLEDVALSDRARAVELGLREAQQAFEHGLTAPGAE
ncbi:MAG: hypothetical protein PHY79_13100 [Anaerolineae bacterium]|nr:hypothetical protein [Anaerolineae bacterium]